MIRGVVHEALQQLSDSGLYGTATDFARWLRFKEGWQIEETEVQSALDELLSAGRLERHSDYPDDYISKDIIKLPDSFDFQCPRLLSQSPIQFFRSLLSVFLRQKKVTAEYEIDIVIAAVEAIENAVKYSSPGDVKVHFELQSGEFHLQIINSVEPIQPNDDVASGKYDSSRTLMRGMMVMSRLFDEMDIDIDDATNRAIFRAKKRVSS